jgi:hypothetical protein
VNVPIAMEISSWRGLGWGLGLWRGGQSWYIFGWAAVVTADTTGAELTLAAIDGTATAAPERSVAPAAKRGKVTFMVSARAIRMAPP